MVAKIKKKFNEIMQDTNPKIEAIKVNSHKFTERIFQTKDDVFSLSTSLMLWVFMGYYIIKEINRADERVIDWKLGFIEFQDMPRAVYLLILTVGFSFILNYSRSLLGKLEKYIDSKIDKHESK